MQVLNVIMSVPPKNMVIKMPSYSVQNMGKSQQYGTEISYFIEYLILQFHCFVSICETIKSCVSNFCYTCM